MQLCRCCSVCRHTCGCISVGGIRTLITPHIHQLLELGGEMEQNRGEGVGGRLGMLGDNINMSKVSQGFLNSVKSQGTPLWLLRVPYPIRMLRVNFCFQGFTKRWANPKNYVQERSGGCAF